MFPKGITDTFKFGDPLSVDWLIDAVKTLENGQLTIKNKDDAQDTHINKLIDDVNTLNVLTGYRTIVSKNILSVTNSDPDTLTYTIINSTTGEFEDQPTTVYVPCVITGYIKVKPDSDIVLSRQATTTTRIIEKLRGAKFYDINKNSIGYIVTPNTSAPGNWYTYIHVPANCEYVRLNFVQTQYMQISTGYYFMLEYGQTDTEYEPYFVDYIVPAKLPFLNNKNICVYGDSLAADGTRGHNAWIDRIYNYYGFKTVYNRGEGGSFVTSENAAGTARTSIAYVDSDGYAWERTAYSSTQSNIPSGYTAIDAAMSGDARVATIPTDTDILIIEAGVNDWASTTASSATGEALFLNSYKSMLSKIITRIPNAKIFCCVCPYFSTGDNATNTESFNKHRDLIRQASNEYGCTVIELKNNMGVNSININTFSSDGLHYNKDDGKRRVTNTVIDAINSYINTLL